MSKYDPISHSRTMWYDSARTKNHPKHCKDVHQFCSIDYEWGNENAKLTEMNKPIHSTLDNTTLPNPREKGELKYEDMTEEALDDWVAQSMNRTMNSILNPNKKFFLPTPLDEDFKVRYRKKRKHLTIEQDDTYFKTKSARNHSRAEAQNNKSYLSHKKKNTIDITELVYDYRKLAPVSSRVGTRSISLRENRNRKKKVEIKRRNAVLLENDIHYERLMNELKRQQSKGSSSSVIEERKVVEALNRNKLFTHNYESLRRRSMKKETPASIIEAQGVELDFGGQHKYKLEKVGKEEAIKQQEKQQYYRLKGNERAEKAYRDIENIAAARRRHSTKKSNKKSTSDEQQEGGRSKFGLNNVFQMLGNIFAASTSTTKPSKQQLGRRAMQLLEEMQVESEHIDSDMVCFEMHIPYTALQRSEPESASHRWIVKAQKELGWGHLDIGHECLKQAIIAQPELFNPVVNFAAVLERKHRLAACLQWLSLAREFEADNELVTFGRALVHFKRRDFDEAFGSINALISSLDFEGRGVQLKYYYLRALCLKKFGSFNRARDDYLKVLESSKPSVHKHITSLLFSSLLARHRRLSIKVDPYADVKLKESLFLLFHSNKPRLIHDPDDKLTLLTKIQNFSFFKRFPNSFLEKLLSTSTYECIPAEKIIFVKQSECLIVLNGLIAVKNHQKDILEPETVAILKEGDFIGADSIDNQWNLKLNNWYQTKTDVEVLKVGNVNFKSIWKGQITFEWDFKYNFLRYNQLLKGLPESTLFKLCELMKKVTFPRHEVLFNDCSYRFQQINKIGEGFALSRNSTQIDPRFVRERQMTKREGAETKRRYRLAELLKKHIFKFNEMKFSTIRYPGVFILVDGQLEIEDDKGFRNSEILQRGDFFGENLVLKCDGLNNYGRIVVASETAQLYLLSIEDLLWCFTEEDKTQMLKNCQNEHSRRSLSVVKSLRKDYHLMISNKYALKETRSAWKK